MQTKPTALCPNRQQSLSPSFRSAFTSHSPSLSVTPTAGNVLHSTSHGAHTFLRTAYNSRPEWLCVWGNHCDGCWPLKAVFTVIYADIYVYIFIWLWMCTYFYASVNAIAAFCHILPFRSVAFCYVTLTNNASHAAPQPTPLSSVP